MFLVLLVPTVEGGHVTFGVHIPPRRTHRLTQSCLTPRGWGYDLEPQLLPTTLYRGDRGEHTPQGTFEPRSPIHRLGPVVTEFLPRLTLLDLDCDLTPLLPPGSPLGGDGLLQLLQFEYPLNSLFGQEIPDIIPVGVLVFPRTPVDVADRLRCVLEVLGQNTRSPPGTPQPGLVVVVTEDEFGVGDELGPVVKEHPCPRPSHHLRFPQETYRRVTCRGKSTVIIPLG